MKNLNNSKEKEIWKDIDGLEGEYAISNKGRVKNLKTNKILAEIDNGHGYKQVILKGKHYLVHRLVALAFLPNPNKLPYINHKNEIKHDNNVENLEWCSASYNTNYSSHKQSCEIKQLTLDGQLVNIWESSMQIEKETGYSAGNIIKCCKGRHKQAYGFQWEYVNTEFQRIVNRPVAALTKDGELVAEYKSGAEASRCLKIRKQCVYLCLNGTIKSTHGLKFIYID